VSRYAARTDRLRSLIEDEKLDRLLVTNIVNVRYLCGFGGTNGVCLIGGEERFFITDFRYVERAQSEVSDYDVVRGKQDLIDKITELVEQRARNGLRLGFDDENVTVSAHRKLASKLPERVELVPAGGLVERLRAVKDEQEIAAITRATELADELYRWLIEEHGLAGHSELGIARALERRATEIGADDVAFPPIVAAGANGALPHAMPGREEIARGCLVVVDLGCMLEGYCSDCTRTFATGKVDGEARDVYELVHAAQWAAVEAVGADAEAAAVDAVARQRIEGAGRGDQFGHGVGHGVGLEVHEAPRVGPNAEGRLTEGNVVTIEPGVYVPGRFGVRIEDLVVVRPGGADVLTSVSRELTVV
jgi:Xaa-Pro aminopeptidase